MLDSCGLLQQNVFPPLIVACLSKAPQWEGTVVLGPILLKDSDPQEESIQQPQTQDEALTGNS